MTRSATKTRTLVECALLIAVGTVLAQIKILDMPYGGSVTLLSMLPFVMVSMRHGVVWGLATGFVNSLLQMMLGFYAPPAGTVFAFVGMILLDYILAFTLLGTAKWFSGFFKNKMIGVAMGTACVCFLRFVCSFLSGILIWSSYQSEYSWAAGMPTALYSLIYNGGYMLPELILTTLGAILLYRAAPKLFCTT